jgi:NADH:ubiquinone oxidoreductase subunit 5 (subunit L)/multisubunit Na+/H+ antiporter MnhA subunit
LITARPGRRGAGCAPDAVQLDPGRAVPAQRRAADRHAVDQLRLLITFVGSLIHVYSLGYMSPRPDKRRFFAYLNLFVASMLLLVLADSYLLLFVGWEGVGLASYLLIGFWNHNPAYATAANKAFFVNRVGDIGLCRWPSC